MCDILKKVCANKTSYQTKHPTRSPTFIASHVCDFFSLQACFTNFHPAGNNVPALFRTNTLFWLAWYPSRVFAFSWGLMQPCLSQVLKMPEQPLAPWKPLLYGVLLSFRRKFKEWGKYISGCHLHTCYFLPLSSLLYIQSSVFPPAGNESMHFVTLVQSYSIPRLFWIICEISPYMCILFPIFITQ